MNLGDQINTYDPTLALRGENGEFRVTAQGGDKTLQLYLRCEPGEPPTIIGWGDPANNVGGNNRVFLLTKVSEPVNVANNMPAEHVTPFRQTA
jgi:hypothetical protein